jgi:DNA-binding LacI/PurR family transcriptional regulator
MRFEWELNMNGALLTESPRRRRGKTDYSYKFQRLREKIRHAVASGELAGKLPGERELAKRFEVNAKTLSKALTDLAAEGLLSRSIGRGTFVKGSENQASAQGPWLLVCDEGQVQSPLIEALRRQNPRLEIVRDVSSLRPSFLNQFTAIVDLAAQTPDAFVRDMLVRNLPLVVVGREPRTYSTNGVVLDVSYLASRLGQELMLSGHRRFAAVESASQGTVAKSLRATASRYAPDARIESCSPRDVPQLIENGVTAIVCDTTAGAAEVTRLLSDASIAIPGVASVAAVGQADTDYPCTGFYLASDQEAEAVTHLLQSARAVGGTLLWLTGKYVDRGTTGAAPASASASPPLLTLTA